MSFAKGLKFLYNHKKKFKTIDYEIQLLTEKEKKKKTRKLNTENKRNKNKVEGRETQWMCPEKK